MMPAAARRLIVNADDFGRTQGINEGVIEAHARGIVTSATLMVGYETARDAARSARAHPALGIGLHVALTGGRPVCDPATVPSLVDASGRFPAKPEGLGGARADDVAREIAAQLERFLAWVGRLPTHLDSHHHSHRLPLVRDAVIAIARAHDLPVRNASRAVGEALTTAQVPTTDVFVEDFFGENVTVETLVRIIESLRPGVTEVMCHPARIDDALRQGSSYVDARAAELEALIDPRVRAALERSGVALTSFGALCVQQHR